MAKSRLMKSGAATFNGSRLRDARKAAGLSQSYLAARIGAHTTSISDWERGRNEPSGRHLIGITRETKRSVEYFYDDADEEDDQAVLRRVAGELVSLGHDDLARDLQRLAHAHRDGGRQ